MRGQHIMVVDRVVKLACIALTLSLGSQVANAASPAGMGRSLNLPPASSFIRTSGATLAPFAFVRFCRSNQTDCEADRGASIVDMTAENRRKLQSVNASVNRSIKPVNDAPSQGDVWAADVASGDCEDFALTKRRHLIAQGWPARSLRIAVARTRSGEGHAVLVVKTSDGDLVLDNRFSAIRTWDKTDLTWEKIQSEENPRLWFAI